MSSGDPQTRKRILEKTWQLMERRQGREVRIDDVASAASVSRQAVYLHFGSRAGLLIATVRYVDEVKGVEARLQGVLTAPNAPDTLNGLIDFWGNYIPEIYGLAKALLAARETDEGAAAAWEDRMRALRDGCRAVIQCLAREKMLALPWNIDQAADALWAMLSISVWENLTLECGWTNREYVSRMKALSKRTFVK
jgi:AcrR family transcriptional regulator